MKQYYSLVICNILYFGWSFKATPMLNTYYLILVLISTFTNMFLN